ncbi:MULTISPECIES: DNA polymerase III subunit epsilon [Mesorhizobium]|uniref:DNA polymerase III subunit epsilon n=1 Tax=Mesorhizobium denitrificans TaxID=2294114 RepID=A0A371XGY1_9HYPH|nr:MULTISPECIES: DNA polymerase III subunit epsilon [Mesorhizobium]RFC68487.1 DNA polymerase III subunit epsilon [Mesorhizobium denitrificans]
MREIIFDTETTGLDFKLDRVIEIGAIELVNRFPSGRVFHEYIHPENRDIHPDALAVHGISMESLVGKPVFSGIADRFMEFIDGAKLVAHNATFDMNFINAEFERLGVAAVDASLVVDTLVLARRKHPMGPNSLDALCRRYSIDNSRRTKHGALLDSELLAEVYVELIGGKQAAMLLDSPIGGFGGRGSSRDAPIVIRSRPVPLPPRISPEESEAHNRLVAGLGENSIWSKFAAGPEAPAEE